jgi:hypothetical protein
MAGSFYIVTGLTNVRPGVLTWSQLSDLYDNGHDVGGHTVHHIDLASSLYTVGLKTAEVCDNYQALVEHGFNPGDFRLSVRRLRRDGGEHRRRVWL